MADTPQWRQGYDALERQVGPRLEQLVQSEQFAVAIGLLARVQRGIETESGRMTRRILHRLNLPAGSDVTRILNEIGQLRRQVHELTVELDEARAELAVASAAAPTPKPSTKRASTKQTSTKQGGGRGHARP